MIWCQEQLRRKEEFEDVIFTDESSVQLEQHSRICFQKCSQPRLLKQRAKHPIKIHIWDGISVRGATKVIMFTGNMNAERLGIILEARLLPFIVDKFSSGHQLYHDYDPTSYYIEDFFKEHNIKWRPTRRIWTSMKMCEGQWNNTWKLITSQETYWNSSMVLRASGSHLHQMCVNVI